MRDLQGIWKAAQSIYKQSSVKTKLLSVGACASGLAAGGTLVLSIDAQKNMMTTIADNAFAGADLMINTSGDFNQMAVATTLYALTAVSAYKFAAHARLNLDSDFSPK